jgi:tRNA uridine 5-carboxymethylaminomethyl modification enzyme
VQPGTALAQQLDQRLEKPLGREYRLCEILSRPDISYRDLADACRVSGYRDEFAEAEVAEQVEIAFKYQGYIVRQQDEIEKLKRQENARLPADFDYRSIPGLSNELRQKLSDARPDSIGRAARIQGVTPAAVSLLLVYLKKHQVLQDKHLASKAAGTA